MSDDGERIKIGHRPTLYRDEYVEQVHKLCMLSARDVDVADFFNVTKQTIYNWQKEHPEFAEAMRSGKMDPDIKVAESLFRRATGYSHDAKHYPPDTTACIIWLKNRRPDIWRDKQDVALSGRVDSGVLVVPIGATDVDWAQLASQQQKVIGPGNGDHDDGPA